MGIEWRCSCCRRPVAKTAGFPADAAVCSRCGRWICHGCQDTNTSRQVPAVVCADCTIPPVSPPGGAAPAEGPPDSEPVSYVEPRVMRHRTAAGSEEYAIHEVYLGADRQVQAYTQDALSPREPTIEDLRVRLTSLLKREDEKVLTGDLRYAYCKEDIEWWLEHIDDAPLDFEQAEEVRRS
jgi:hypothetical protein